MRHGVVALLLVAGHGCRDATPLRVLPDSTIQVHPAPTTIAFTVEGKPYEVAIDSSIEPARWNIAWDTVDVLAASVLHDTTFLLLDIQGPSRPPEGAMGYCGSGREAFLMAVAISTDLPGGTMQAVPYDSCLYSVGEGGGGVRLFQADPDSIWGEWDHYQNKTHLRVHYERRHPSAGLQLAVTPLGPSH